MGEYSEIAANLRASLKETEDRIGEITSVRDEARAAISQAASVREQAERLQLFGPTPEGTHLRVVPDRGTTPAPTGDAEAPLGQPASDTTPESSAPVATPTQNTDRATQSPPDEVIIRGPRLRQILDVMSSKPGINWNSEDIAAVLGLSKGDAAGRHSLRQSLRALAERGALERVTVTGDWHTYYRPLMNWKFV
ncbi:hypothetical protein [Streptomyces sp. CC219B]|uniref:hypothetical protein n=1 Tax=Streptomyces sp. CC219B TaxID=3044574 RepID=UPI0024A90EB7|nr:hypothetical protein [Streptomyces sp. CC219B]